MIKVFAISNLIIATAGAGTFTATTETNSLPHEQAPKGMAWIPGGEFSMGGPESDGVCNATGACRDMAGSVWEWCSDWYRPDYYEQLAKDGKVSRNPKGPDASFDPLEPHEKKRVQRGGSFLCSDQYCTRYMVGTRGKGEITSGSNHLGFRCVKPATVRAENTAKAE